MDVGRWAESKSCLYPQHRMVYDSMMVYCSGIRNETIAVPRTLNMLTQAATQGITTLSYLHYNRSLLHYDIIIVQKYPKVSKSRLLSKAITGSGKRPSYKPQMQSGHWWPAILRSNKDAKVESVVLLRVRMRQKIHHSNACAGQRKTSCDQRLSLLQRFSSAIKNGSSPLECAFHPDMKVRRGQTSHASDLN